MACQVACPLGERVTSRLRVSYEELAALPNLGPASARWLVGAGITTVAELRRVGAVAAFGRVAVREGSAATAGLLYALYAALEGKHWTEVTPADKARLRRAAGLR